MDANIQRALNDKLYDKRKVGALELEKVIRDLIAAGDEQRVQEILEQLCNDYAYTVHQPHARNGGLIGLAAAAIAIGVELPHYLVKIVPPVLACFTDQDARTRYYACEAMYNIAKVAKGEILVYFNSIFDQLCKLGADSELSIKNGAELLDRLIKDIVSESAASYVSVLETPLEFNGKDKPEAENQHPNLPTAFSLPRFIPLLKERIWVTHPTTRQFLVGWITLLDSIPDLELVTYLPDFLGGLLKFLSDQNTDVRVPTQTCLDKFLSEIKRISQIKKGIIESRRSKEGGKRKRQESLDSGSLRPELEEGDEVASDALNDDDDEDVEEDWIPGQDVEINYKEILEILVATLHSSKGPAAAGSPGIPQVQDLDYAAAVNSLTLLFLNDHEATRVAALTWLIMLHKKAPRKLLAFNDGTFPALLKTLSDPSDAVVTRDLQLLSQISRNSEDDYFTSFMVNLLQLFSTDRGLLETRGNLIIRQLCISLSPERIYRTLADCIEKEEDVEFASIMVQNLNNNLITAPQLAEVRKRLRNLETRDGQTLFAALFRSWCYNAVATFSLCLLAQAYEQAYNLLQIFGELDMTVNMLIQVDKLVQLIESPVFTYLRLQLLEPERYPYLYKCMYGILMLLPQSSAFAALKNRLNSCPASSSTGSSSNYAE
ncbi:Protein VAC14 -like protein [Escovopsis weberi]|uniref:Protein VAC14-like protein n=1 Tax=Escovopsis weberi TaxID=150374 RepID=A0A0M8MTR9_ESCWE|nr:Protein VAC14 -like protein [Escovopsis weberi]